LPETKQRFGIQPKHFEATFLIFKRLHEREKYGAGTGLTIAKMN
jgi:light-regulated signal transduction histidine kinase (bacteriophytochrome)